MVSENPITPSPGAIRLEDIVFSFGDIEVFKNLDLAIQGGEFIAIVGRTGCGKSTLLNIIAGFCQPNSGRVSIDGIEIKEPNEKIGVVFQEYNLFPWKTAIGNVNIGSQVQQEKAEELIKLVGLDGFQNHYPYQLSGGMQQRVALARCMANRPEIMLMDEPFGALDPQTRRTMQDVLLDVWRSHSTTIVFVTHDIEEAIYLSDKVYVLLDRPSSSMQEFGIGFKRPRNPHLLLNSEFHAKKIEILNFSSHINANNS